MGVYIVSWALTRLIEETESEETHEFQTLLQIAKNCCSSQEACAAVQDAFTETEQAMDGWVIIGPPAVLAVSQDIAEDWLTNCDPPPANTSKKQRPDYLKPIR
jgi:hypothetical protein